MIHDDKINAGLFVMAAKTLFEDRWISRTAELLGVNERTIRRIASDSADGNAKPSLVLLRPLLLALRARRAELDKVLHYVEMHASARIMEVGQYAVLRFIEQDDLGSLAGLDGDLSACVAFGWVKGGCGDAILTDLGRAAFETEYAARAARGEDLDPDPRRIAA